MERVQPQTFLDFARDSGLALRALAPDAGRNIRSVNFRGRSALIVGNEGGGISAELLKACEPVSIPTQTVESLNAAVACSIALYEAHNQRMGHEPV